MELLNLVPLGGLSLSLKPLRLTGLTGWGGLGAAAAQEWMRDISRNQVGCGWGLGCSLRQGISARGLLVPACCKTKWRIMP